MLPHRERPRQARRGSEGWLEGINLAAGGAASYRTASNTAQRFSPRTNMCPGTCLSSSSRGTITDGCGPESGIRIGEG